MPKNQDLTAAAESAISIAKDQKGNQKLRILQAFVDPSSYCTFSAREDVIAHFEIDPVPNDLTDSDVVYVPRKKVVTTTKKLNTVSSTGAGNMSANTGNLIGKAIKIPCGTGLLRNIKGVQKNIKFVIIRVPAQMSNSAICLWINTCFKQASKKPSFFMTQAGARVNINSSFTAKSSLPNKKNI